jgi:L-ascorbate metabolism protein UlaG (beta-lactamase superfamily)
MLNHTPLYIRPDLQVEPLVDNWYLWSHLVPPQTAARNLTERHLKIMDSYINAPQIHANAVKNPKMSGGPFIDYGGQRVDEIKSLRNDTKQKRAHLIDLSSAINQVDDLLRCSAKGSTLQPLYPSVPSALRGYVELVYDLNNNAAIRILEPLLYRSKYYDTSSQTLMFSLTKGDDRPFVLSTPRLPSDDSVQVSVPFHDNSIDELFSTKKQPKGWGNIKELLRLPDRSDKLFRTFLTEQKPPPYQPYTGSGVRWRYFGHACILIEARGLSFLFDPVLSYTYESAISRYTYNDLPDHIDFVIVTHNHQDHILFETLLQIRHKVGTVVVPRASGGSMQDPSVKLALEAVGFKRVIEMAELDTVAFEDGGLTGLPFFGEHSDLDVRSKLAYILRIGQYSLMFAADSCNVEPKLYENLSRELGSVDVLFVGMECDGAPLSWLYGPLLTHRIDRAMDESRRLAGSNYEQAIDIVNRFGCKEVYVYAMGQEPWLNHVMSLKYTAESRPITESNRLIQDCTSRGIIAERLFGEKEILLP